MEWEGVGRRERFFGDGDAPMGGGRGRLAYRQGVFSINKTFLHLCTCDATFPFTCNHNWGPVIIVIIEALLSTTGMSRELCLNLFYYNHRPNNFVYDLYWNKECEIHLMQNSLNLHCTVIYIQLIKSMTPSPVIYYLSYNHQYIVFILVSIHVPLLYLTWNVLTFCSLESRISPQLLRNLSGPNDSDRATVTFFLGVNSLLFMVRFSSAIISYFLLFHT